MGASRTARAGEDSTGGETGSEEWDVDGELERR